MSFITNTVTAAYILHNYCIDENDVYNFPEDNNEDFNLENDNEELGIQNYRIGRHRRMQLFNELFPE